MIEDPAVHGDDCPVCREWMGKREKERAAASPAAARLQASIERDRATAKRGRSAQLAEREPRETP